MELTLKRLIEEAEFRETRRGYDRGEVDDFLDRAASMSGKVEVQLAQAIERGRAAETRLKELEADIDGEVEQRLAQRAPAAPAEGESAPAPSHAEEDHGEELKRTLVLAQRTADAAIREAREEADRVVVAARTQAEQTRAQAQAEAQAHRTSALEDAAKEVRQLASDRDALRNELAALESHLELQRTQLRSSLDDLIAVLDDPARLTMDQPPERTEVTVPDLEPRPAEDAPADAADEAAPADGAPEAEGDAEPEVERAAPQAAEAERPTMAVDDREFGGWRPEPDQVNVVIDAPEAAPADEPPSPQLAFDEVDHAAPDAGGRPSESGPPPAPVEAHSGGSSRPAGSKPAVSGPPVEEDAFLAELRKAMHDEEPLGPSSHELPAPDDRGPLFDQDDRNRNRSRFGRRR